MKFARANQRTEPHPSSLKRGPSEDLTAGNGVAVLAGLRWRGLSVFHRALGNCTDSGSEVLAVTQRIEFHAEDRSGGKAAGRDSLLRHSRSARHLDAPADQFLVVVAHRLAVGSERNEVKLGMIRLRYKTGGHTCQRHRLRLIVHGKGVVG